MLVMHSYHLGEGIEDYCISGNKGSGEHGALSLAHGILEDGKNVVFEVGESATFCVLCVVSVFGVYFSY